MAIHNTYKVPFFSSAARTGTTASSWFNIAGYLEGSVFLDVTAATGTLDVVVEASADDGDTKTAFTHTTFSQKTVVTKDLKNITVLGKWLRINATIGGATPSFTFSVVGVFKT